MAPFLLLSDTHDSFKTATHRLLFVPSPNKPKKSII